MARGELVLMLLSMLATAAHSQILPTNVPAVKLLDELNYQLPGMERVKAAVDAGNLAKAKSELLAHFRSRSDAQGRPKPNPKYDTRLADNILIGKFIWGKDTCTYGPKVEDIEWYRVPKGIYWPKFDHELGRHTFVTTLVNAYRNTGDDKYVRHLVALLLDFIDKCPVEDGRGMPRIDNMDGAAARAIGVEGLCTKGHPAMQWTQMAAMRGLQKWPSVLQYCIHSPAITPDALAAMLTSMIERQRYLVDALPFTSPGNHGTRTPTTVIEVAAKLPEITERDVWIDRATAELLRRYNWYGPDNRYGFVYRDGATVEVSPVVAWGDYGTLLLAMRWLEMAGRQIPPQLKTVREKMVEYLAYCTWPNVFAQRTKRPRNVPYLPGRGDLDYITSGGTKGAVPKHASYPMRTGDPCYAGTYFMRSGWSADAVVLRVRFGPTQYKYSMRGLGDVGDIGLWGHGMLLVPHVCQHPRTGPFADYGDRSFRGDGRSENTISLDGVGQSRTHRIRWVNKPLDSLWVTTPVLDFVRGSYRFDHRKVKATHTRAILFVKPDYFVVIDRVDGDEKPHRYRMKYQLHHHLQALASGTRVVGAKDGVPRVVVAPCRPDLDLSIVKGQREPFYEGWHLYASEKAAAAPALIYEWEEPAPAKVETVIWPVAPGSPADLEVVRRVATGVTTLTITRRDSIDVVSWGDDRGVALLRSNPSGVAAACTVGEMPIRAKGVTLRGSRLGVAYVRLDPAGQWVASSNCDAAIAVTGRDVQVLEWDGP